MWILLCSRAHYLISWDGNCHHWWKSKSCSPQSRRTLGHRSWNRWQNHLWNSWYSLLLCSRCCLPQSCHIPHTHMMSPQWLSLWLRDIHLTPSCTSPSYLCLAAGSHWKAEDWKRKEFRKPSQFHLARAQELIVESKVNELQGSPWSKITQLQFWAQPVMLVPPTCLGETTVYNVAPLFTISYQLCW